MKVTKEMLIDGIILRIKGLSANEVRRKVIEVYGIKISLSYCRQIMKEHSYCGKSKYGPIAVQQARVDTIKFPVKMRA